MAIELSVVICTYIRTHRLLDCLRSLEKQTLQKDLFEVVIVSKDLCSEDRKLLDDFTDNSKLNIRHINEERRGLSIARNAGIKQASGEIIHFLDDDTITEPKCLESYLVLFKSKNPLCAGGKILPNFLVQPPGWFGDGHLPFLGTLDIGNKVCEFNYPANFPVGANVAFKREVFEKYGLFDENLGIHGRKNVGGEETDLCYRIQIAGGKIIYCPDAVVYHCIEEYKLLRKWFAKTAYRQGKGAAILQLKHHSIKNILVKNLRSFSQRFNRSSRVSRSHRGSVLQWDIYLPLTAGYGVEIIKSLLRF